jgi:hypothetical protein
MLMRPNVNYLRTILLLTFVSLSGCTHVRPWERAQLAHHSMTEEQTGPALSHVYAVHEGAVGGEGASNSGCGCN